MTRRAAVFVIGPEVIGVIGFAEVLEDFYHVPSHPPLRQEQVWARFSENDEANEKKKMR